MLPRLHPDAQRRIEKLLDGGGAIPREEALLLWQELIAVRALVNRWAAIIQFQDGPRLRAAARGLQRALDPTIDTDVNETDFDRGS